ncbi:MAG: hypothetical protein NTX59_01785 [Elusimicrobia bacterium]|nr:hypothetical protein [Elusimicrobiota bacterium]
MKKTILSAAMFLCMASGGFAGGFNLNSVSISDLKGSDNGTIAAVPVPAESLAAMTKAPNLAPALDMSIKLPFSELNKRMVGLCDDMQVLDQAKPVLFRQGDHIVFTNVTVDYHGVDIEPTVLIKPSFDGNNRLAIRLTKVDADIAFGPNTGKGMNNINKDDLMASIAGSLTASMLESMDESFAANKVPLKAKNMLSFTYDKASWTLRAAVTPDFVAPLLPGLISNVSLTAFSFDDKGFILSVKSGSGASISQMPGYNLALSDGLLTNFLRKYAEGSDYDLAPQGHDGGVKFRADGRVEVALKAYMRDMTFKPNVYAVIELTPVLIAPNTIVIRFEKVTVDQAYGIGIPGFINNMLQGKAITGIVSGIMTSQDLTRTMSARKLDDNTVELKLKNSAFLPSFARGVIIKNMKIGQGLMYLGFEF